MCMFSKTVKTEVSSVYNSHGEIETEVQTNNIPVDLPEHVDWPFLNRDVPRGVLGFRYETKTNMLIVYSSVETKTFCMIMHLSPMRG